MTATTTSAEMRVRRVLLEYADLHDVPVTYRQVVAMARLAAKAAAAPRPPDVAPAPGRPFVAGVDPRRAKRPRRPSAATGVLPEKPLQGA